MIHQCADCRVDKVDTYILTIPRSTPYLGPLGADEFINSRGYVVRKGNGVIYPTIDRSVVVRVRGTDGIEGWGETYGICAPRATCEIINDLLAPVLQGRPVEDVECLWDELYGLMRVRGCTGGFYTDALAALDIALWDLKAKHQGLPLHKLLGRSERETIPGYLSGLPAATLAERLDLATSWQQSGIDAFKFAAVISHEGVAKEFSELRRALGASASIMVDLHWKYSAKDALAMANAIAPHDPAFMEAPVKSEDLAGLIAVCKASKVPIAVGEEWSTWYEAKIRLDRARLGYFQPEMAHTGITQFLRIARRCEELNIPLAPHATIGVGIFLAASLQVSRICKNFWRHEWQHSVFGKNLRYIDTSMDFENNYYTPPVGDGLGVRIGGDFWKVAQHVQ